MHQILEILEESSDSAGPDLISLDDLKLALGITGSTEDATLQAAITFQSRIIAEYCHRRFGKAEALETFVFDRHHAMYDIAMHDIQPMRQALVLSLYPIVEIFEVSTAGATAGGWHFDPASGLLWLHEYCDYWVHTVEVVYSGGYDLPEQAPARLQQAVILQIGRQRMSGLRDPSIREVAHGDTHVGYYTQNLAYGSNDYLGAVTDLINPYRRQYVA